MINDPVSVGDAWVRTITNQKGSDIIFTQTSEINSTNDIISIPLSFDNSLSYVSLVIHWENNDAQCYFNIELPNGNSISNENIDQDPNWDYIMTDRYCIINTSAMQEGNWNIQLSQLGAGVSPGRISFTATGKSPYKFESITNDIYFIDDPIKIEAKFELYGEVAQNIDVSAQIILPDGSIANYVLEDNGDGTYSQDIHNQNNITGDYQISLYATDGMQLTRLQYNILYIDKFYDHTFDKAVSIIEYAPSYYTNISIGDINRDSYNDLLLSSHSTIEDELFINNGQFFTKDFVYQFGNWNSGSSSWGDFNNDGYIDIFTINPVYDEPNMLIKNSFHGFEQLTNDDVGDIVSIIPNTTCSSWGDFNNDGYIDLLVGSSSENFVLENLEGSRFAFVSIDGVTTQSNSTYNCNWVDYNNDGLLDIYFINSNSLQLFKNENGSFIEVNFGLDPSTSFENSAWGDFDNNGYLDISLLSTNGSTNSIDILLNTGEEFILYYPSVGSISLDLYEISAVDYNNDGKLDIFVNGNQINWLFENNTDSFILNTDNYATSRSTVSHAWIDYNLDGKMDLIQSTTRPKGVRFLENSSNNNNWINVRCNGSSSNETGIGARVVVAAFISGELVGQTKVIGLNNSQQGKEAHFGLGDAAEVKQIDIYWPGGKTSSLGNVQPNQFIQVNQLNLLGGTITSDTTIGDVIVTSNVFIPEGVTLTITPLAEVLFENGTGLIVKGKVIGGDKDFGRITFGSYGNQNNSSGFWQGIFVDQGEIYLDNCIINDATNGIEINSGSGEILNSHFSNNDYGVSLLNSNNVIIDGSSFIDNGYGLLLSFSSPIVTNNYFESNSDYGVYAYRSESIMSNNHFFDNPNIGLKVADRSIINLSTVYDINNATVNNHFEKNRTSIYVERGSVPNLGKYVDKGQTIFGGYNYFDNQQVSDIETYEAKISGEVNWWGEEVLTSGSGIVLFDPTADYLFGPIARSFASQDDSTQSEILIGYELELDSLYFNAISVYNQIILNNYSEEIAGEALCGIIRCYNYLNDFDALDYDLISHYNNYPEYELGIAALDYSISNKIITGNYDLALSRSYELLEIVVGTELEPAVLLEMSIILGMITNEQNKNNRTNQPDNFTTVINRNLNEIINDYSETSASEIAAWLLDQKHSVSSSNYSNIFELPEKYNLYQAFPNPFNPVTTIKFDLPISSYVTITVYDIIGREVTTLVNNKTLSAGTNYAQWLGTNQTGNDVASGVYLYTISAKALESEKIFTDKKKMILLK